MNEHIKVNNKTNNLGDAVAVSTTDNKLCVTVSTHMAKRYLKVGMCSTFNSSTLLRSI